MPSIRIGGGAAVTAKLVPSRARQFLSTPPDAEVPNKTTCSFYESAIRGTESNSTIRRPNVK
jgi:hypothetical protein